jgi:hypothetical protein
MVTFVLRGKTYEVKTLDVVEKLKDVKPEAVKEHYVIINDQKYPIKQVIALVLDVPRISFTSMDAYNILRRLGFDVH